MDVGDGAGEGVDEKPARLQACMSGDSYAFTLTTPDSHQSRPCQHHATSISLSAAQHRGKLNGATQMLQTSP